jgi:putative peptide zinc metalloprotease protein
MSTPVSGARALIDRTSPLSGMSPAARATVAGALTDLHLPAGHVVFDEGEPLDALFVVASGRVESRCQTVPDGSRRLASLGPGEIFGAVGVVTGMRQNATVTTLEETVLYVVPGASLRAVARAEPAFAALLLEEALLRSRPLRRAGVIEHHRDGAGLLLESPEGRYFRVDERDQVVWSHIDGQHTVSELVLVALRNGGIGNPTRSLRLCQRLEDSGFISALSAHDGLRPTRQASAWRRAVERGGYLLPIRGVAPLFRQLYRRFGFVFFKPAIQALLALLVVAGAVAFVGSAGVESIRARPSPRVYLPWVYGGWVVSMLLHELGHALATVWCGCDVRSAGIGWFWFGPVAFVDTTETWKASRFERVVVSLAGPAVTLLFASLVSIVASVSSGSVAQVAWIVASLNYVGAALNLNPLLKLDGYYVLADLLDRPNLRSEALRWLWRGLIPAWRRRSELRRHWIDLAYGAGALLYAVGFALLVTCVCRVRLAALLTAIMSEPAARILSLALAGFVVALACASVASELSPRARLDLVPAEREAKTNGHA